MTSLPTHGRIECTDCFPGTPVIFDKARRGNANWRITANPLAWGNQVAEIVVLGFSKGPTQAGALARSEHDDIAFKKGRGNIGKIFAFLGLIPSGDLNQLRRRVDELIADRHGRFHFGSLIRCTVERYDHHKGSWKSSGCGMLDKFVPTPFGQEITRN